MLEKINIEDIKNIAIEAGIAVMEIYKKDFSVEYKDDKSPLTEADLKANEIICKALKELKLTSNISILSEENKEVPYEIRKNWEYYWCIDPIDGTKEFIKKNNEFTINIALIHKDTPALGVVYAPALGELYYSKRGEGAFKEVLNVKCEVLSKEKLPLNQNQDLQNSISVVASKSHMSEDTQKFVDNLALNTKNLTLVSKGSSLKLCMVATGEADIYPRLAPTMEWDTAAAHAIVLESGKNVFIYDENISVRNFLSTVDHLSSILVAMVYNKVNLLNSWFVVK